MKSWQREIRETFNLGIPMAFAQISQTLMTTTDVALVGRLEGTALAAMAVGQASYGLLLSLGIGLMAAVGPLVSQAHGADNPKIIARTVGLGFFVAIFVGLLFWTPLYFVNHLYDLIGYTSELKRFATGYCRAVLLGLPFALLFFVQKNYLDSISRPRWPMVVAVVGIFVNAIADYVFMYGYFGVPALGVTGTGLATSAVNLFMAAALVPVAWKPEFTAAVKRGFLGVKERAALKEFFQVGLPIAGSIGIEVGLFVVGALMMGKLGADEAAAHQIVLTCAATTFMFPLGISFAGSTRVGQAVGKRDFHAVRPAGLAAMFVGTTFMLVTAFLFLTTPGPIVDLFWDPTVEKTASVKLFAVQLLMIAGVFQIADGIQVTAIGALRGLKDVNVPLGICALSYWLIGLGSAVYLTFYTPLRHQGLWIGFLLGLATAALALTIRFLVLSTRVKTDQTLQQRVRVEAVDE